MTYQKLLDYFDKYMDPERPPANGDNWSCHKDCGKPCYEKEHCLLHYYLVIKFEYIKNIEYKCEHKEAKDRISNKFENYRCSICKYKPENSKDFEEFLSKTKRTSADINSLFIWSGDLSVSSNSQLVKEIFKALKLKDKTVASFKKESSVNDFWEKRLSTL